MSKFLEKYNIIQSSKILKRIDNTLSAEEKNRLKLIGAIDTQLNFIDHNLEGDISFQNEKDKKQKLRLFWQDTLGGFLFTPRFGNDFLFGKDRGVRCATFEELRGLLEDFKIAVGHGEFDDRIKEIADSRKGRGAGVLRNRS